MIGHTRSRIIMTNALESSWWYDERIEQAFADIIGVARVAANIPLAPRTTFRMGGAADWFLETGDGADVRRAVLASRELGLPLTILGGGSNVLVGARGVRGLVVCLRHGSITQPTPDSVRVDAGVSVNALVRWSIQRGLAGVETWAGTPGTVGGAVAGNAHFQGVLIGDRIRAVGMVDREGRAHRVDSAQMGFGYDQSRLQETGEVAIWAEFRVTEDDPISLRASARQSLRFRKRTQPLAEPSAGCIFRNPDPVRDPVPPGLPASAGALVDAAGLKNRSVGRARVSERHANFIVSDGTASAVDIRTLIEECRTAVRKRFGVALRNEIVYMGEF